MPTFWTNTSPICRSESNQLKLYLFLTICGSKLNNYSTLMQCRLIYSNNTNNYSSNNSKKAEVQFLIFNICFEKGRILKFDIGYSLWYSLRDRTIHFLLRLLFNLGIWGSCFTSTTNLEAGPQFADIWLTYLTNVSPGSVVNMQRIVHRWNKSINEYMKVNGRMSNLIFATIFMTNWFKL